MHLVDTRIKSSLRVEGPSVFPSQITSRSVRACIAQEGCSELTVGALWRVEQRVCWVARISPRLATQVDARDASCKAEPGCQPIYRRVVLGRVAHPSVVCFGWGFSDMIAKADPMAYSLKNGENPTLAKRWLGWGTRAPAL